ncbi:MAG: Fis family transcriptional regulator [Oscillatoria sp. PMC 1068.18]|nr:Fis family transcriptional regulator [Oscillatoria sp. PMC 1076.18]MEC4990245.1 Fis family transcriptional regulator [Oscillatoria sp. PMC 1068.18]
MNSDRNQLKLIEQRKGKKLEMKNQERDRFELLSAFLDGEVTATERKQVLEWLDNDPKAQQLHSRLLKIRHGIQAIPVPETQPTAEISQQVFRKIDRRRWQKVACWGGGAIAAVFVGAVSGILPGAYSPLPRLAQSPEVETAAEPLMLAINQPAVEIPKAAVSVPEKSVQSFPESKNSRFDN